nr:hypothetical protein [uncultured Pseudoxanthomonas sp.]
MSTDDIATFPDDDLPLVRRGFPWPIRAGCVGAGAFAVVMPLWELGRGLWPLNVATPFFAVIVGGAGYVGLQFIRAGLSGWSDHWQYSSHTIVVHRRAWGRQTATRLTTTNVAAVEVRLSEDADHDDAPWQVVIVPRPTFSGLAAAADAGGVFDTGCYGSQDYAERVRRALIDHLGL